MMIAAGPRQRSQARDELAVLAQSSNNAAGGLP